MSNLDYLEILSKLGYDEIVLMDKILKVQGLSVDSVLINAKEVNPRVQKIINDFVWQNSRLIRRETLAHLMNLSPNDKPEYLMYPISFEKQLKIIQKSTKDTVNILSQMDNTKYLASKFWCALANNCNKNEAGELLKLFMNSTQLSAPIKKELFNKCDQSKLFAHCLLEKILMKEYLKYNPDVKNNIQILCRCIADIQVLALLLPQLNSEDLNKVKNYYKNYMNSYPQYQRVFDQDEINREKKMLQSNIETTKKSKVHKL